MTKIQHRVSNYWRKGFGSSKKEALFLQLNGQEVVFFFFTKEVALGVVAGEGQS